MLILLASHKRLNTSREPQRARTCNLLSPSCRSLSPSPSRICAHLRSHQHLDTSAHAHASTVPRTRVASFTIVLLHMRSFVSVPTLTPAPCAHATVGGLQVLSIIVSKFLEPCAARSMFTPKVHQTVFSNVCSPTHLPHLPY